MGGCDVSLWMSLPSSRLGGFSTLAPVGGGGGAEGSPVSQSFPWWGQLPETGTSNNSLASLVWAALSGPFFLL